MLFFLLFLAQRTAQADSSPFHLASCLQTQAVATAIENKDWAKAVSLRDAEFVEMLDSFVASSTQDERFLLPESQRMRVGIIQFVDPFLSLNWHDTTCCSSVSLILSQRWCSRRRNERCHSTSRPVLSLARPHPLRRLQRIQRSSLR